VFWREKKCLNLNIYYTEHDNTHTIKRAFAPPNFKEMSLVKMQEIGAVVAQVLGEPNLIVATLCDFFCWRYFDKVNKDHLEGLEQACNTPAPENW